MRNRNLINSPNVAVNVRPAIQTRHINDIQEVSHMSINRIDLKYLALATALALTTGAPTTTMAADLSTQTPEIEN